MAHRGGLSGRAEFALSDQVILPQILGSLPEVFGVAATPPPPPPPHKVFARPFGVERSLSRSQPPEPSGRPALGSGIRPEAPLAPSLGDVRSAGRDTWNLTGEALAAAPESDHAETVLPREIGAPLGHPGRSLRCPRPPRTPRIPAARAPILHERPLTLRPTPAAALVQPGRACAEPADRPVLAPAGGFAGVGSCRHRHPGVPTSPPLFGISCQLGVDRCAHPPLASPAPPARGVAP